jgi:hypothetical protein
MKHNSIERQYCLLCETTRQDRHKIGRFILCNITPSKGKTVYSTTSFFKCVRLQKVRNKVGRFILHNPTPSKAKTVYSTTSRFK